MPEIITHPARILIYGCKSNLGGTTHIFAWKYPKGTNAVSIVTRELHALKIFFTVITCYMIESEAPNNLLKWDDWLEDFQPVLHNETTLELLKTIQ